MLATEPTPSQVLPDLDPHLGDHLGDELLLTAATKRSRKVKAGLHSSAASRRHDARAWTADGDVD